MVVARHTMEPISPSELGRGHMGPLERKIGVLQRGILPAGEIGPARQDVSLDGRPMAGRLDPEPLEHSVSMEGEFGPEPLEHLVRDVRLDSRPRQGELNSGPLEHSVPDRAPRGGAVLCERLTVSEPLEHSVPVGPPQWGETDYRRRRTQRSICNPHVSRESHQSRSEWKFHS